MNKKIFSFLLLLIILTAIQDVLIPESSPLRYITVITQSFGVLVSIFAFFKFIIQVDKYFFRFSFWLTLFIVMLTSYAIFNPLQITNYSKVLYSLLPFYVFYNVSRQGISIENNLQKFSIIMVLVSVYQLYVGYFVRMEELSGDLLDKADNIAYQLLSVMVLISVLKPKIINIFLICIVYVAILFSLKRGAILSSTIVLIFYFLEFRRNYKKDSKFILIFGSATFLIGIPLLIRKYSEILLYRFIIDESGGSGRESMYTSIYNDWLSFPLINKIFGRGFFSLFDGLGYAHSDWLQLLYDHGVFGIILFICVIILLFNFRKKIKIFNQKHYYPFLGLCFVIFFKSIFSGTYMTKYDAIIYGVIGLMMGIIYRKQKTYSS